MVENPVSSIVVGVGTADDAYQREVFTVRAGDGVEDAKSSDSESDDAGSNTASPSIAVGGVSGVELVAAADQV